MAEREQKDRNKGQRKKGEKTEARNSRKKGVALKCAVIVKAVPACQAGSRHSVSQSPWLQQDRCPGFDLHMLFRAWSHHLSLFFYCF